jgi:hypothetical protein
MLSCACTCACANTGYMDSDSDGISALNETHDPRKSPAIRDAIKNVDHDATTYEKQEIRGRRCRPTSVQSLRMSEQASLQQVGKTTCSR